MTRTKKTTLNDALVDIERSFGAGSVMRLGERPALSFEVVPTGSVRLDKALGIGGLPRGKIVEIYGPEASGKTTLVQHVIANAQKDGLVCAFIDAEHCLDMDYAQRCGVDIGSLLFSQPSSGEEALEIVLRLVQSGDVGVVAIDSVAALTPRAELDGEMGEAVMGAQARLMAQAMRKLVGPAAKTKTLIVFTNQLREAIGVLFGSPERQPGGRALKFAASCRLDIRRIETIKDADGAVANRVRVKIVKNKVAPPLKTAEFVIRYGEGIDQKQERLDIGIEDGTISKSGSWITLPSGQRVQGMEQARVAL